MSNRISIPPRQYDTSSCWSDPCTDGEAKPASLLSNELDGKYSIYIPLILQPFLGLETVPCRPFNSVDETRSSICDETQADKYHKSDTTSFDSGEIKFDDESRIHTEEMLISEPYDVDELEKPTEDENLNSPAKKNRFRGQRIKKIVKKFKRKNPMGTVVCSPAKQQPQNPVDVAPNSTKSSLPKSAPSADFSELLMRNQGLFLKYQEHMRCIREECCVIQKHALTVENRISALEKQADTLQQAFIAVVQKLQEEKCSLQSTRSRLSELEEQAQLSTTCIIEEAITSMKSLSVKSQQQFTSTDDIKNDSEITSSTSNLSLSSNKSATSRASSSNKPPPIVTRRRSATEEYTTKTPGRQSMKRGSINRIESIVPSTSEGFESIHGTPIRRRANTEPQLCPTPEVSSFIRVNDLSISSRFDFNLATSSSPKIPGRSPSPRHQSSFSPSDLDSLFFMDQNIKLVLESLFELGFQVVTDESDRFKPTKDTHKLLHKYSAKNQPICISDPKTLRGWPIKPWHSASVLQDEVLVWTGEVDHDGFGHDWPVVKARGVVHAPARKLLDLLLDSAQIKRYNKMSQGREDLIVLQAGINTTAQDSAYGFSGEAKIMRALNKPKLLPKTIEMLSLCYARPLLDAPEGSYMIVSRSVWEDDSDTTASATNQSNNMIRSEMLLGVHLLRHCCKGGCCTELTTITHVHSPGVPEVMAKRMSPSSASGMIKDIQSLFPTQCTWKTASLQ